MEYGLKSPDYTMVILVTHKYVSSFVLTEYNSQWSRLTYRPYSFDKLISGQQPCYSFHSILCEYFEVSFNISIKIWYSRHKYFPLFCKCSRIVTINNKLRICLYDKFTSILYVYFATSSYRHRVIYQSYTGYFKCFGRALINNIGLNIGRPFHILIKTWFSDNRLWKCMLYVVIVSTLS